MTIGFWLDTFLLAACDVRVQLGRPAQQELMGHQDHPDSQDLVFLDLKDLQVFPAAQVDQDHRAFLDLQVINHRTALSNDVPSVRWLE